MFAACKTWIMVFSVMLQMYLCMCAFAIPRVHGMNYSFIWKPIFKHNLWIHKYFQFCHHFRNMRNVTYDYMFGIGLCLDSARVIKRNGSVVELKMCNRQSRQREKGEIKTLLITIFGSFFIIWFSGIKWFSDDGFSAGFKNAKFLAFCIERREKYY